MYITLIFAYPSVIIRQIYKNKLIVFNKYIYIYLLTKALSFNLLKPELNPICYLLALLGAHHFLHVSRIRVKSLTLR